MKQTPIEAVEIVFIPQRTPTRAIVCLKENGEIIPLVDHPEFSIDTVIT